MELPVDAYYQEYIANRHQLIGTNSKQHRGGVVTGSGRSSIFFSHTLARGPFSASPPNLKS